jgi:hypothetical protein
MSLLQSVILCVVMPLGFIVDNHLQICTVLRTRNQNTITYSRENFTTVCWVELSLSYARRSVDQFVLVSGSPLGPMTRFYPYLFFSDNCFVVLPVWRPLWREDGSVVYSVIAEWSGHWGPITIHYRLIWDCVPSSSPLTTLRDCGGSILTRLHTGTNLCCMCLLISLFITIIC